METAAMLSDDVYRSKFDAALANIARAVEELADVADIDARRERSNFRLALQPRMRGACPLELLLRADQRYDLQVGSEFYEDCEVHAFEDFEALVRAVASGRVVTRHYFSAATGSLRSVETVVMFADGRDWRKSHRIAGRDDGSNEGADGILVKDRTFLPYRR